MTTECHGRKGSDKPHPGNRKHSRPHVGQGASAFAVLPIITNRDGVVLPTSTCGAASRGGERSSACVKLHVRSCQTL